MYDYTARLLDAHDGDTVKLCVDLGFTTRALPKDRDFGFHLYLEAGHLRKHDTFRVLGIDAPELSTPRGKIARAYALDWLALNCAQDTHAGVPAYRLRIVTEKDSQEKYGRFLATVYGTKAGRGNESLAVDMVATGNALAWDGKGARPVQPTT